MISTKGAASLRQYWVLAALAIVHAAIVLAVWYAFMYADRYLIPAPLWLALVWLWLAWVLALAIHPARSAWLFVLSTAIGALMLAPCISTAYSFTSWAFWGLAP